MWADVSQVFVPASGSNSAFISTVIIDRTDRKRAEEALQKTQTELAHVARVTTLGELTASIAHEVSQPLAAMSTNASASLRWLAGDSPNLAEAPRSGSPHPSRWKSGQRCDRTDAGSFQKRSRRERAGGHQRDHPKFSRLPRRNSRNRVSLKTECAEDLPMVVGDKVQLRNK